ncbi:multiheme c-type cytochrome [Nitrospira sp. BLG_2]|uniref:multiheme c-type cytochrome n=1 Tax=Nitrospira sp. BLG_2 TaxID=3397507 RepID=UPI003B9BCEE7
MTFAHVAAHLMPGLVLAGLLGINAQIAQRASTSSTVFALKSGQLSISFCNQPSPGDVWRPMSTVAVDAALSQTPSFHSIDSGTIYVPESIPHHMLSYPEATARLGGARVIGSCLLFDPGTFGFRQIAEKFPSQASIVSYGEGEVTLMCSPVPFHFAIAGRAAALIQCDRVSSVVVAVQDRDVGLARRVAALIDTMLSKDEVFARAASKSIPSAVIVTDCRSFGEPSDSLGGLGSNVFVGPFAKESPELAFRVCAFVIRSYLYSLDPIGPEWPRVLLSAAFADQFLETALHWSSVLSTDAARVRMLDQVPKLAALRRDLQAPTERLFERLVELYGPVIVPRVRALLTARPAEECSSAASALLRACEDARALNSLCKPGDLDEAVRAFAATDIRRRSLIAVDDTAASTPVTITEPCCAVLDAGDTAGYLETCGCKGVKGGGFTDIVLAWSRSPARGADSIKILHGNVVGASGRRGFDPLANRLILDGVRQLDVKAMVLGSIELLALAYGDLDEVALTGIPVMAANVTDRTGSVRGSPVRVVNWGTEKVAIVPTTWLTPRLLTRREDELVRDRFNIADPVVSVRDIVTNLPEDVVVVLAGTHDPAEFGRMVEALGPRRAVVVSGDPYIARNDADSTVVRKQRDGTVGQVPVVFSSGNAYFGLALKLELGSLKHSSNLMLLHDENAAPHPFVETARRALEQSEEPHPDYRQRDPLLETSAHYIGSSACMACHRSEYFDWANTPHAVAYKTLERKQRHRVTQCVVCHVVGFGAESGFSLARPEDDLRGVGCEVCHGPGSKHVLQPHDPRLVRRSPADSLCAQCHDAKHSSFLVSDRETYRRRVAHRGTAK